MSKKMRAVSMIATTVWLIMAVMLPHSTPILGWYMYGIAVLMSFLASKSSGKANLLFPILAFLTPLVELSWAWAYKINLFDPEITLCFNHSGINTYVVYTVVIPIFLYFINALINLKTAKI